MKTKITEQSAMWHAGKVVAGDAETVTVRFERSAMCKHCGACLEVGEREMEIRVRNDKGAAIGDTVEVALEKKALLTATLLCYMIPLVGLLLGMWIGSLFGEWVAFGMGLGTCALSLCALIPIERKVKKNAQFQPRLLSVVKQQTKGE